MGSSVHRIIFTKIGHPNLQLNLDLLQLSMKKILRLIKNLELINQILKWDPLKFMEKSDLIKFMQQIGILKSMII